MESSLYRPEYWNEDQIEHGLQSETRVLSMPDGSKHSLSRFRLTWEIFDNLAKFVPADQFVKFALEEMKLQNLTFDEAFDCVLAYGDKVLFADKRNQKNREIDGQIRIYLEGIERTRGKARAAFNRSR